MGMRGKALAVAVLVLLGALACSSSDETEDTDERTDITTAGSDEVKPGGTLTFGLDAETNGWSPVDNQWGTSGYLVALTIFDRLMGYDAEGRVHPYLAEEMVPDDTFETWTIELRDGIEFHDGTPLDAQAVVDNLLAHQVSVLTGQAFTAMETATAVDPLTVEVTMTEPWSTFPQVLTAQTGYIAAPSQLEDPNGSTNPVGTGPYVFDQWTQDLSLTVTKNPDYWREGYPLLDEIEFRVLTDVVTRGQSLESGDVDVIETDDGAQIAAFEERARDGEYQVFIDEDGENTEWLLYLNTEIPPFDDPTAREAVQLAIDKEQISETVFDGRFPPADGPFRESSEWYAEDVDWPQYDPDRASELVARYTDETGEPLAFDAVAPPDPNNQALLQAIQQQLADVGIEMSLDPVEAAAAIIPVASGDYQLGSSSILWGSNHPDREYLFIHGRNVKPLGQLSTAFTRLQDPEIDAALDEARTTDDRDEQIEQWAIVQQQIAENGDWVFIVHNELADIAQTDVRDLTDWTFPDGTQGLPQEQSVVPLYQAWLDR